MENAAPRFNGSSILAACIVAAALIVSALIVTHRPPAYGGPLIASRLTTKPMAVPPVDQAAAQEQFQAQVLAAPALHTFYYNGKAYTLADVKVKRVTYSAKDDNFGVLYDWVWQPVMPSDGPQSDYVTLNNDGYGHYYGSVGASLIGTDKSVDVTIK